MSIKLSTVNNISSILPKRDNVYAFNPTISRAFADTYLCAYRTFVRYPELHQQGEGYNYGNNPYTDPNHPWLGGKSTTWWNSIHGEDSTRFAVLRIDENKARLLQSYEDGGMHSSDGKVILGGRMYGNDARLLRIGRNKKSTVFILSYNKWIQDPSVVLKDGKDCSKWCGLIATRVVKLMDDLSLVLGRETVLCPELSNTVEKNWSFWTHSKDNSPGLNVFFSYGLYPTHDVVNVQLEEGLVKCGISMGSAQSGFFTDMVKYYGSSLNISVTTPAIALQHKYLGVGHVKFKYKDLDRCPPNSSLKQFIKDMNEEDKIFHPTFVYLMFLYTFSNETADLLEISDMFLPPSKYAICFPSGICAMYDHNKILVSYGDGDTTSAYFTMTINQITNALRSVSQLKPQDIQFLMIEKGYIHENAHLLKTKRKLATRDK
jgi:hypothetical protein